MEVGKRIFDLVFSGLLLLVLFPVILAVALAVKCTTTGPIFFRRLRHGRNAAPFEILKFRTLERANGRLFCVGLGEILRRTCLDELPQLWNVLRGEMSLVGPRPLDMEESEELGRQFPEHYRRYAVTPGLTGLAQVNGMRGALLAGEHLEVRLALDLKYVENRNFWLDLRVLLATPASLLNRGAGDHLPQCDPTPSRYSLEKIPTIVY